MSVIRPIEVSDVELAFGGNVVRLLPSYDEIPDEYKSATNEYNMFVSAWFFQGVGKLEVSPRDGVNLSLAIRHIAAILRSFEPKHEHKIAGAAYLASVFLKRYKSRNKSVRWNHINTQKIRLK